MYGRCGAPRVSNMVLESTDFLFEDFIDFAPVKPIDIVGVHGIGIGNALK
jgi:hypothetical protein